MAVNPLTGQSGKQFKLDLELKDRALAAQIAADNALDAFRNKQMQLIQQGQLQQQADQFAKDYALQTYKFEFEKELGLRQITSAEQAQAFAQQLSTRQQDFDERWRSAEQTGFVNGTPTLDREKFWESQQQFAQTFGEGQRQFNQTFGEGQRQFDITTGENQRQFNVGQVLNAPRGPADWAAYTTRLRGLNSRGDLPSVIGNLMTGKPIAAYSNAGQETGAVMTNTRMAQLATGGPAAYSQAAGGQQQPTNQAGQLFGLNGMGPQGRGPQRSGRDVSYQQFQNLTPDEQEMAVGYAGEGQGGFMPQSEADFMDQMKDAAPQFRPSTQSRFFGMR